MKKQIAFISEHASPLAILGGVDSGGQNVYVAETAKQLSAMGFDIDIFTRWENPDVDKVITWMPGIRVIHLKAGEKKVLPKEELLEHMPEFREQMLDFVLSENKNYFLIHAHFFMSALVAADIKRILNIPFVVTFHALGAIRRKFQGMNDGFPEERIDVEKRVAKEADYIVAECPQDKIDLIKYYSASPGKIVIIPCGFSSQEFYPVNKQHARKLLGIDLSEKILLQLGRMVKRKGIDNVIMALAHLKEAGHRCKLIIVGGECCPEEFNNDPELKRLKGIAYEYDVLDDIIFTGKKSRRELKYYYSAADVFITTPWYEPFGITPLEAMACGTPVIGSNVGGIKFSVADGETGFLVPPTNPKALAEKVAHILFDKQLTAWMKRNALQRVKKFFTWENVCVQLSMLYAKLYSIKSGYYEIQSYLS
ncbi:MAG: glycosyltransferase family 1 protein [Chitinophagaceae bacterium]|nr:glycosyltransferase family 1 protein [Chitinophagaceae bacterium]